MFILSKKNQIFIMVDIKLDVEGKLSLLPSPVVPTLCQNACEGFQCSLCRLTFEREEDLNFHRTSSEPLIPCQMCSIKFLTMKGMKQHFGKKHEKSRPYRCGICFKRFRNVYASRIHKQQVHLHTSRQVCTYCSKSVYNKYSLSRHLKICARKALELEISFR